MNDVIIQFSPYEIDKCLKETSVRLQRILYVYEQSLRNEKYDYKGYVYSTILYINSFNALCNYDLTHIIVNLNTLYINNKSLDKKNVKKIIMECKHMITDIKKKWSDDHGKN